MTTRYKVGQGYVITATCRDEDGVLADPDTITFYIDTNGIEYSFDQTDPEVTSPSTGIWKCRPPAVLVSARHQIRCVTEGPVTASAQTEFDVPPVNALVAGQLIP